MLLRLGVASFFTRALELLPGLEEYEDMNSDAAVSDINRLLSLMKKRRRSLDDGDGDDDDASLR